MLHNIHKNRLITAVLIAVFIVVTVFGLMHSAFGMDDKDQKMGGCPFMGMAAICTMNFSEHVQRWQNMFAAIVSKIVNLTILALGLILFVFYNRYCFNSAHERRKTSYYLQRPHPQFSNFLEEAFSQGILHSRRFAFATH